MYLSSYQPLTLSTRPSGPRPRPSLRVTLLPRPRSPLRHLLPPRRPRHPSNRSQTYQIPSISLKMADHVIMANVNSQTQVLSLSDQNSIMGRAKERWFFFFFSFFLSSRFSCSSTPQVFYSLLCTVPRRTFEKLPLGLLRVGEWRG